MNEMEKEGVAGEVKLLFFSCATGYYKNFIVPYVLFASLSNPGSSFEFMVDGAEDFLARHGKTIEFLEQKLGSSLKIRDIPKTALKPIMANSWRFILTPETRAEFVYIGDVDILIVEDILAKHAPVFEAGYRYSNIVRPGGKRLSGLHLTRWEAMYPLPEIDDLVSTIANDEMLLYAIVERRSGIQEGSSCAERLVGRPVHGLHMSLNRLPFFYPWDRPSWGVSYEVAEQVAAVFASPEVEEAMEMLHPSARLVLANAVVLSAGVLALGRERFKKLTSVTSDPRPNRAGEHIVEAIEGSEGALRKVFEEIFRTNRWGAKESVSGPSSTLARTGTLRKNFPDVLQKFSISSVLDAPCGDLNWMTGLLKERLFKYTGADIVPGLIEANRERLAGVPDVELLEIDLTFGPLPYSDMLLSRDFMFHLSYADTLRFLQRFVESGIPYILTTTHLNKTGFENRDIKSGGWRWMDLFIAPYNFPRDVLWRTMDGGGDREMCLWSRDQIRGVVDRFHVA